jgi:hypothetical protein
LRQGPSGCPSDFVKKKRKADGAEDEERMTDQQEDICKVTLKDMG